MQKWLISLIIDKAFKYIYKIVVEWLEHQRAKKAAKKKVKEIMKEVDPQKRAQNMKDFLNK